MVYVWEFEFFDSDGIVDAVPCDSLGGGGTAGRPKEVPIAV